MDGYFLRDEDIISGNPGESFDLIDWKVSPSTDFSLESPELHFTTENLLNNRVTKEDKTLEDSDSWFSVLNTKESWSETKTKSLQEGYLNEQVVPDQGQLDQKTKSVPIQEIQSNFAKISKNHFTKENICSPIQISTNIIMDSGLEGVITPENSNNTMFVVDHKEQVKSEQGSFETPPANVLFTFSPLCQEKIVEEIAENNIKEELSTESVKFGVEKSLPVHATQINEEDKQLKTQNSEQTASESVQPANIETNLKIKLEENKTEHQNCGEKSRENEIIKIRKKIFKLLSKTKIPKCTMVDYKFDSSNKLPSFAETFCPDLSEKQTRKPKDIELPDVLQNVNTRDDDNDEEMFIVLSESDSESSDTEQDDELDQNNESEAKSLESLNSEELPKIKIKSEEMGTESEIPNKAQNADTPSSMLAIDDELEKYLVSSIMLNDTTQSNDSQLPDLSNNIGSILKSEELSEEHSMDSVYGSLFSKPELQVHGVRTCKQEQNTDLTEALNNYQGHLLNGSALLGGERPWQEHITQANMSTLYGWTRSVPSESYANQIRHNNIFHIGDPFMSNTDFKTMTGLPTEIMQTDIDPFKFTNLVPKVEVMDSSLNYGF